MANNNIIDLIFESKDTSQLFDLDDEELQELSNKVTKADNDITKFIDTKIHPKCREKMKKLVMQYSIDTGAYYHRENQILYNNGFKDCLNFVLTSLLTK